MVVVGALTRDGALRVTLFAGVRSLGGLQTILLNMAEVG